LAIPDSAKAGAALFIGTVQFSILLIVSEAVYPGYSVSGNYISDLGATCAGGSCTIPPSSSIFNASVALLGLLVLLSSYFLQRSFRWKPITGLVALTGIGALGVGVFPETAGYLHGIFSLIAFLFAGLSAVVAYRFQTSPLSYFSVVLGAITLLSLVLYVGHYYAGLGPGGMERIVVYPVLLWGAGFGGHLMSSGGPATPARSA
jgi:hypothetical membrane protein